MYSEWLGDSSLKRHTCCQLLVFTYTLLRVYDFKNSMQPIYWFQVILASSQAIQKGNEYHCLFPWMQDGLVLSKGSANFIIV